MCQKPTLPSMITRFHFQPKFVFPLFHVYLRLFVYRTNGSPADDLSKSTFLEHSDFDVCWIKWESLNGVKSKQRHEPFSLLPLLFFSSLFLLQPIEEVVLHEKCRWYDDVIFGSESKFQRSNWLLLLFVSSNVRYVLYLHNMYLETQWFYAQE